MSTSASIASAIGTARMPTQGSWRPVVTTSTGLSVDVDGPARHLDARGRLERHVHDHVLARRDAAEGSAGVVGQEALRASVRRDARDPRCATTRETGADLDRLSPR